GIAGSRIHRDALDIRRSRRAGGRARQRTRSSARAGCGKISMSWAPAQIAARAALDIADGSFVNLGIGLPELVADHIPEGREIILHSENGILGMGPRPTADAEDMDLINAGKKPVTLLAGGAFFHHADSFAMIRGGHIDVCILGAYEVTCAGDLANWTSGA